MVSIKINLLDRKKRYLLQTFLFLILGYFLFFFSYVSIVVQLVVSFLFVVLSLLFSHYPNVKINNIVYGSILPLQLVISSVLFYFFYPNLSFQFKLVTLIGFVFLFYIASFVDNVFLVIQDREEQIPLYRAATTWGQIISVVISIPLFAAISKLNIIFLWQSLLIFLSATLFSIYHFWIYSFDDFLKKPKAGEYIWLNLFVGFLVFISSAAFSFMPFESFLRALFISSVLMFSLNYVQGHLKNNINQKFLYQSFYISLLFLVILIVFR